MCLVWLRMSCKKNNWFFFREMEDAWFKCCFFGIQLYLHSKMVLVFCCENLETCPKFHILNYRFFFDEIEDFWFLAAPNMQISNQDHTLNDHFLAFLCNLNPMKYIILANLLLLLLIGSFVRGKFWKVVGPSNVVIWW